MTAEELADLTELIREQIKQARPLSPEARAELRRLLPPVRTKQSPPS
jgi:hypothetical protein